MDSNVNQTRVERLLFRVDEAAEALAVSRSQAFKLIWAGELPSVRIGRSVRVPARAVTEYVERLSGVAV